MDDDDALDDTDFDRLPGLYRVWDLQGVLCRERDYRIHFADLTRGGTPLFAVYARREAPQPVGRQ